ncbi:hypothetical protein Q3G72_031430 [Acer saccharum]|nr:hypothetical protein Q3G72_031430 [Acer saccharum]
MNQLKGLQIVHNSRSTDSLADSLAKEDWLPSFVVFPFGVVSSLRGAVCIPFVLLAIWLFITLLFVEQIALDVSRFKKWRQRTITMFYGLMMKMMMVMVDMV